MMLSIMVYLVLIACLIGGAAYLAERIVAGTGRVRRGIWLVSLAASVVLPGYSLLADFGPAAAGFDPLRAAQEAVGPSGPDVALTAPGAGEAPQLTLPDWSRWPIFGRWYATGRPSWTALDRFLAAAWIGSCAVALLVYGFA